jgi:Putative regulator of cell autolysis
MDTLLSKRKKLLLIISHLAGWVLFIYLTMPLANRKEDMPDSSLFPWFFVTSYLFLIAYFYFNIQVLVLRFLSKKRIILFLGITFVAFFLYCFAIPWLIRHCFLTESPFRHGMPPIHPGFPPPGGSRTGMSEVIRHLGFYSRSSQFLIIFIAGTGFKAISQWYAEKQRLQELEKSMIQAELSFLKSQIHPHFLFNSLNSIYYLALSKDDKAPEAILSLSDFLRFVTTECNQSYISLEKEVKSLEEYIHLQSLRASEKFELQFLVKGDLSQYSIMPLTFIPFVENAFKYGISAHIDCFIHIGIEIENSSLKFTCDNSVFSGINDRNNSGGTGLENIRKRLKLTYPEHHSLAVGFDSQAFHIKLQINLA